MVPLFACSSACNSAPTISTHPIVLSNEDPEDRIEMQRGTQLSTSLNADRRGAVLLPKIEMSSRTGSRGRRFFNAEVNWMLHAIENKMPICALD